MLVGSGWREGALSRRKELKEFVRLVESLQDQR